MTSQTTGDAVPTTHLRPGPTTARRRGSWPRPGPSRPVASDRAVEAERLAAALARWYAEALAGRRDVRALRDLLTPAVAQRVRCAVLRESARRLGGGTSQAAVVAVRRTHVQRHGERFEATVVVDDGTRATAVAASLHRRASGWVVTDLARPEDRLPALPSPWFPDPTTDG